MTNPTNKEGLVARLTDPNFRGPFQHLRDWSELDRLHDEAAALLRREPSVEEVAAAIFDNLGKSDDVMRAAQAVAALWGREPG